ncbi:MAG: hypothetical protein QXK94_01690 [Candidatus Jordarchaeales archaeon]
MKNSSELEVVVFNVFKNAFPHLCEPSKIRELLEKVVKQTVSIEELMFKLQEEERQCSSATYKTDLKILLFYLEKDLRKLKHKGSDVF